MGYPTMIMTRSLPGPGPLAGVAKPQLTSLIDVLTILLVFLLKSFSVEGQLVTAADDLILPESTSHERPIPTLNVEISAGVISVDGDAIVDTDQVRAGTDMLITELEERLGHVAAATGLTGIRQDVTIQCDQRMDFAVVKKVMYTCSHANYADFALLVFEEDD